MTGTPFMARPVILNLLVLVLIVAGLVLLLS